MFYLLRLIDVRAVAAGSIVTKDVPLLPGMALATQETAPKPIYRVGVKLATVIA